MQIVEGEILSWSVVGLKGLIYKYSYINKFLEVEVLVKKTLQKSNGLIRVLMQCGPNGESRSAGEYFK